MDLALRAAADVYRRTGNPLLIALLQTTTVDTDMGNLDVHHSPGCVLPEVKYGNDVRSQRGEQRKR